MTVNEAIQKIQGRRAGLVNRLSAQYAQSLLQPQEQVSAAVVANVAARGERFPGIVVLTDQRVIAVCGLPGIRRSILFDLDQLSAIQETPTALHYKAVFATRDSAFSFTVNPEVGERFSRCIAVLKGEEEAFDAAGAQVSDGIFNPALVRSKIRSRQAREKERSRRAAERAQAQARRQERTAAPSQAAPEENLQEMADRLARQLEDAKTRGHVADTDPQAVAARLAAELAAEETGKKDAL